MLARDGFLDIEEVVNIPGFPGTETLNNKKCVVIECKQNIPCNRVKGEHPPGITGPARKQHNKMDPDKKHHRNIHRENGGKHICNRTNAAFCSARCKNQYNVYKTRAKSREDKENE